jgi:hypothetical protein
MTAITVTHIQKIKPTMTKEKVIRVWVALLFVFVGITAVFGPAVTSAYAQAQTCDDGLDQDGDPCLDIQAESLMAQIFRWTNFIIPVLLPLVAIGIGITFGGSILQGIKNFFGSFRLG